MQVEPKLKKISTVITDYNLKPKKSLGQNFLLDLNLTEKIVNSMGNLEKYDVLEIGPGPGSLTRSLLSAGARKVVVIEKDEQFLKPLYEISNFYPGRLKVIHGDALMINPRDFLTQPIKIVSNLPYNVGTQILLNLITSESWPPFWKSLTFMFQKEVANRLVAVPRTKSYGRLSIISQWRSTVQILFNIPASSFTPSPKIDSSVVQFSPVTIPDFPAHKQTLEKLVKLSFGQRRKMLRQSLKSVHSDISTELLSIGIDPRSRPEELTVEQFCDLSNKLKHQKFFK